METPLLSHGARRVLEIDGETVVFEVNIVFVPVPRPFLAYRVMDESGAKAGGVLAEMPRHEGSVRDLFDDAELTRLYRVATRTLSRQT
jgi:hypothetical protein